MSNLTELFLSYKRLKWFQCDAKGDSIGESTDHIIEWSDGSCSINFNRHVRYVKFEFYIFSDLMYECIFNVFSDTLTLLTNDDLPNYHEIERSSIYVDKVSNHYLRYNTKHAKFSPHTHRYMTDAEYLDRIDNMILDYRSKKFIKDHNKDLYLYAKYLERENDSLYLNGYKISVSKL